METLIQTLGWRPSTVLDIGGYKGMWTREVRRLLPAATVTVVEPNPHPELKTLGVRVFYEILSSNQTSVPWYSNMTTGDSLYKERTRHYAAVQPVYRTTTTLDTLFPGETFEFVKLDCQGAELDVLRGGPTLLQGTTALLLECPFAGQYNEGAPTFVEYLRTLDELGFAPLEIAEHHRTNGILFQLDIVCLRKTSPLWDRVQTRVTG
jgi:FkbM family methyltransferase